MEGDCRDSVRDQEELTVPSCTSNFVDAVKEFLHSQKEAKQPLALFALSLLGTSAFFGRSARRRLCIMERYNDEVVYTGNVRPNLD